MHLFYNRAREYMAADVSGFLRRSLSKALYFWAPYSQPMTEDRPRVPFEKVAAILSYGVLFPFALFRLVTRLREDRAAVLVFAIFLAYTAVHTVVLSKIRFRLPPDSFVIIYGSGGILAFAGFAHRRLSERGIRWSWMERLAG